MGKQHNKAEKRNRRKAYLKRKRDLARTSSALGKSGDSAPAKKASKKAAAKKAPAKKAPAKKAPAKKEANETSED